MAHLCYQGTPLRLRRLQQQALELANWVHDQGVTVEVEADVQDAQMQMAK